MLKSLINIMLMHIMANSTWFNSLSPDLQKIIMDVGKEIGKRSTDLIMDTEKALLEIPKEVELLLHFRG